MKRLTERNENGKVIAKTLEFQNLIDELAEYEDLEEQGLLLRLPCKVGDYLYEPRPDRKMTTEYIVNSIAYIGDSVFIVWKLNSGIYSNLNGISAEQIGKTVFLTQAEAEEKLKILEEMENE